MSKPDSVALWATTTRASAGNDIGSQFDGLNCYESLTIVAELVGATNGTLDVYVQDSPDGGTTWYDYAHFTQLAAGASAVKYSYVPSLNDQITTIGKGASPVLASGAVRGGKWFDSMRVFVVAGASTSVGAAITVTAYGFKRTEP